jgi:DNA-binding transcriptional MerR regulator
MPASDERLTIGRIARASGLTHRALRHYDALGVLRPAEVDPDSGYRFYTRAQVTEAQLIASLRKLEVPLDEIRRILADPASDDSKERIAAHRRRVAARLDELRTIHYFLGKDGLPMPKRPTSITAVEPETQRKLAAELFNYTWTLIEKQDRTPEETERMLNASHASRFFWGLVGNTVNHARGEWQLARVYSIADLPTDAIRHAESCLALTEEHGIGDFDLACAYEALARAHAVAGERDRSASYEALGREAAARIEDADDRELVLGDLETLP